MCFQLREHKRSQCSSCGARAVLRTRFDSWELHGETDRFIYFSHSGCRHSRRRKSPRVRLCDRDDQQVTGAQSISSNERLGKLVLTCGQEVTSAVIIVISTLYYFHMHMFFFSFLCTTSSQCDEGEKRKHTDDSNLMVCRGQWRF